MVPIAYQRVNPHIIFDVKPEDFWRKDRLVMGGHVMDPPSTLPYAIVVSRETVKIDLILAALNALPVKVADIHNAYITAHATENIWTVLGQVFGEDYERKAILVWALYGSRVQELLFGII